MGRRRQAPAFGSDGPARAHDEAHVPERSGIGKRVAVDTGFSVAFDAPVDLATLAGAVRLDPPVPGQISTAESIDGATHLTFTVLRSDLARAAEVARKVMAELGAGEEVADDNMAKISVRGVGTRSHTGVASRMFHALADSAVNIQLISTSELHITVVVDRDRGPAAATALRQTFGLET